MPTMQDETQVSDHSMSPSMGSPTPGFRNSSSLPSPTCELCSLASPRCHSSVITKVLKIFLLRTLSIFLCLTLWQKSKVA